ncbi:MAG TPA: protein translocase subunit SecD [Candidatus Limnocylindrales bacterium]
MRRAAPILIVLIGLAALVVDFWPNLKIPIVGDPDGNWRTVETKLGLDLQGGLRVEYQALPVQGPNGTKNPGSADMSTIRTIIENRVNSTGVTEPVVQTQGSDRVVVEVPGAANAQQIRDLVGQTGDLEFVPLPKDQYGTVSAPGSKSVTQGAKLDPTLLPTALFNGAALDPSGVQPSYDSTTGQRGVSFTLKGDAATKFAQYTTSHVNEFFAIVLDGVVQSAPYIKQPITDGKGVISGSFTTAQMNQLVTILRYGSLPFPIHEVQVAQVGSTLAGFDLTHGLLGGIIGIGLVLIFMLIYYRLPGLVADTALIYYALVVYAIFRFIPVTLTLAGIAGFVLSVGMAVDANILIFERTKEELRVGKTLPAAIEAGFNRAWNSILDSNVSSLITAGILYWFGSSTIRGFALVLIIGVLTSMFTAVTMSRTLLRYVVRLDSTRKAWLYGVTDEEFLARPVGRAALRGEARGRV